MKTSGILAYFTDQHRVYEFPNLNPDSLLEAAAFCKKYGGRFAFSPAAPTDRYIVIV